MSFIHPLSGLCTNSELDLFSVPPTQTSVESGQWVPYQPITSISSDGPMEFVISARSDEYLDLAHSYLKLRVCIEKADGVKLSKESVVSPVNNFMHSIFRQIDLYLNQKMISSSSHLYPYKAYMENLLSYDTPAKNSHLSTVLWEEDVGDFENLTSNSGCVKRRAFCEESKPFDLLGRLNCEMMSQERLLLNGVEVKLVLVRGRENFFLMGKPEDEGAKLTIQDATLYVRRVKLSPTILLAHSKALSQGTAKYPLTRVEMKSITLSEGIESKTIDNLFLGQTPSRIVFGFVSNKAFNGDITKNPFNFRHFDVNFISINVGSEQFPVRPLEPNFNNGLSLEAYHTLYNGTGLHFKDEGNSISRETYVNGNTLYAFDLTPALCTSFWNPYKTGSVRIDIKFRKALAEAITCVVYAEFQSILEITQDRTVRFDHGG